MSDESSDGIELERVDSLEKPTTYERAPEDTYYKIKMKDKCHKTYMKLEYVLKEGRSLPYMTVLKGTP